METKVKVVPILTLTNFVSEFRDSFKDWAIGEGIAGGIVFRNQDRGYQGTRDARPPTYEMLDDAGEGLPQVRRFANNAQGFSLYQTHLKLHADFVNAKMKIISKLNSHMDSDVRTRVTQVQGYEDAVADGNLHQVWQHVQTVCVGNGAVSIYHVTTQFWELKQKGSQDFPQFTQKWNDVVKQLNSFGEPQQILDAIMNTKFIMGLDQEFFKEKLTPIYGRNQWPNHADLLPELNTYFLNLEKIKAVNTEQGKEEEVAHSSAVKRISQCWKCKSTDHLSSECNVHVICRKCKRAGHLAEFCEELKAMLERRKSSERSAEKAGAYEKRKERKEESSPKGREKGREKRQDKKKKPISSGKGKKGARKSRSYAAEDNFNEEDSVEENDFEADDYQEDDEDEDEEYEEHWDALAIPEVEEKVYKAMNFNGASEPVSPDDIIFLLDTGCKRWHITKHKELLGDVKSVKARVTGITGQSIAANAKGNLPFAGQALYIPEADANLLSVRQILRSINGRSEMNQDRMIIYDRNGALVLVGKCNSPHGKGEFDEFYTCSGRDLLNAEMLLQRSSQKHSSSYPAAFDIDAIEEKHLTPEQLHRAKRAWNLCSLLGHPGFDKIATDLDNGVHPNVDLTSHDVRNAVYKFGPCPHCMEGKMNNPKAVSSTSPPANEIGEHLHADLIKLETVCIGGYTQLLVAVDEKSAFFSVIPAVSKGTQSLCDCFDSMVAIYASFGHRVTKITTDSEPVLKACKNHLGLMGIQLTNTPPDLHERRVERYIQTLKKRKNAILASLRYELPAKLEAEVFLAAANSMNNSSCKASAPYTPYHLVVGKKSVIPQFSFGQIGQFKGNSSANERTNTEWGIFIGHGDSPGSYRGYFPLRNQILVRRKFVPFPTVPPEWESQWKLLPRLRPNRNTAQQQPVAPVATLPQPAQPVQAVPAPPIVQPAPQPLPMPADLPPLPLPPDDPPRQDPPILSNMPPTVTNVPQNGANDPTLQVSKGVQSASKGEISPSVRPQRAATTHKGWLHGRPHASTVANFVADPTSFSVATRISLSNYFAFYGDDLSALEILSSLPTDESIDLSAYRVSLGAALKMDDRLAEINQAIHDELQNMKSTGTIHLLSPSDITPSVLAATIPCHMFLKFKYKADGSFDKVKARLTGNGDRQHPDTIGETYAPTVNPISVKTQLAITAREQLHLAAYDIKGAFLLPSTADRKDNMIYVRVPKQLASLWTRFYPEDSRYLLQNGTFIGRLDKYLYGLAESPNRFNNFFDETIRSLGFKRLKADKCLYYKKTINGKVIVSVHVDDMLVSCSDLKDRTWFENEMGKHFELSAQRDDNISYLGMHICYNREQQTLRIAQDGMIAELLKKYGFDRLKKAPTTPATPSLLQDPKSISGNSSFDRKEYLSLVMSLMFIARFTRHDIQFAVTTLATRSADPRQSDWHHALRVLRYLAGTRKIAPIFNGKVELKPVIYADSSHNCHPTGHGHGGMIITLGSAPIHSQSFKLKLATRSSSESELVVLEESSTFAPWLKLLFRELGVRFSNRPFTVYQDNKSTITIAEAGGGNFKRTKHLISREAFVKERIENGDIKLVYINSSRMRADFLTKPLSKAALCSHLSHLSLI
jgi:hypothetical protein